MLYKRDKRFVLTKLITLLLLLTMCLQPITYASQEELSIKNLSTKSGKECINQLQQFGLKLPEAYSDPTIAEEAVKVIVNDLYMGILNEDAIPYSYTELVKLANQIMGIAQKHDATFAAGYSLVNSTVIGSWNNSYLNYNCYGYSIGKHVLVNPGYHSGQPFSMSLSISQMADLVIDDLDALGYWARKLPTKPTTLASWENLICIRKGSIDYHFMRGNTVNSWAHKPGKTNPLLWNYTSPGYTVWTNEYSAYNESHQGTTSYVSTIYYIRYWLKDGPGPQPYSITSLF